MKITKETLQKIAHLARLDLNPKDEDALMKDMEQIISWVEKLDELQLDENSEFYHGKVLSEETLRTDEKNKTLSHEEALKNAPQKDGRFFKVPNIMK